MALVDFFAGAAASAYSTFPPGPAFVSTVRALDRLEGFTSLNGAAFYGMAANDDTIRLVKRDVPAEYPSHIPAGDETVTVFDPGFPLYWHVEDPA